MTRLLSMLVVCGVAGTAFAQSPGQQEPYPPPPPPAGPYPAPIQPGAPMQPQPYVPAPQAYVPIQLTQDDAELLSKGEISDTQHAGGVVANILFGFGVGQAIQGRYGETGWIFTLGELGSFTAMIVGLVQSFDDCLANDTVSGGVGRLRGSSCSNNGEILFWGGLIGYLGFHVWSIADAITGPANHNRRVRELRMRLGMPQPMYTRIVPYVSKSRDGGGHAGVSIRF